MATVASTNAKIASFIRDTELAHQIVHGTDTTVVATDGGPVDSLAKTMKELGEQSVSVSEDFLNGLEIAVNATADATLAAMDSRINGEADVVLADLNTSVNVAAEGILAGAEAARDTAIDILPHFTATPPASPIAGQMWTDNATGRKYEWVVDVDSSQWVETGAVVSVGIATEVGATGAAQQALESSVSAAAAAAAALASSDAAAATLAGAVKTVDIAAPAGSSLSGHAAEGAGAIPTTVQAELRRSTQSVKARGATGDGATDDRAFIVLADAIGPFVFTAGSYKVASNLTISNHAVFRPGASILVPTGVTVSFEGKLSAGEFKIFELQGTGKVTGLLKARAAWWGADNTGVLDTSPVLTAALLNVPRGLSARKAKIGFSAGGFLFNSIVSDAAGYGARIAGEGLEQTIFVTPNADASILDFSTVGSTVEHIGFNASFVAPLATGDMIKFSGGNQKLQGKVSNVKMYRCFRGVTVLGTSNALITGQYEISDLTVQSYAQSALHIQYANDVQVSRFTFDCGSTTLGSLGGIRLAGNVQGCTFNQGSILTGLYSMTTDGTVNINERPSFCKFNSVYFDSSINGALLAYCLDFDMTDCWASNRPGPGFLLQNSSGVKFIGGGANGCGTHGALVEASTSNTVFNGFTASNNSQNTPGAAHGLTFAAGISDFLVINCILKNFMGLAGSQGYGVYVDAGASDRYVIGPNLTTGNATGGVSDNGTGVNKLVAANF